MRRLITQNLGIKAFSLLLAVLLWIAFGRDPNVETALSAPVQYRGLPDEIELSSRPPGNITVEVHGASRRLDPENLATISVLLDLSHVDGPGERTFNINSRDVRLPLGVEFARAIPAQIRLEFERHISRDVPVQARFGGNLPSGYRLVDTQLSPKAVRIIGPQSHVSAVTAVQTDPIDLTGIIAQREGRVHAWTGDPQVRLDSQNTVTWKITVQKNRKESGR